MRSTRSTGQRLRGLTGPIAALVVSLAFLLLPRNAKEGLASVLEWSVFLPFRYAVGWGPRSLATQSDLRQVSRELASERLRQDLGREVLAENERLRGLLGFMRRSELDLAPGDVVARGRARHGDLLVTRPVDGEKVSEGSPVVSPDGLLGRVASVEGGLARVECLTNRNVAVSVHNARTREEGIVRWEPERRWPLVVQGVPVQADWQIGDRILTSGLGAVFPRGLLVGWVAGSEAERSGILRKVLVKPAANPGKAEVVFYLHESLGASNALDEESGLYPSDPARALSRAEAPEERTLTSGASPVP